MELPQEQFEYQQKLASIGLQISEARVVLDKLKTKQADFLSEQEVKVKQRVNAILAASQEALAEATKNQDSLTQWGQTLAAYHEDLLKIGEQLAKNAEVMESDIAGIYYEIDRVVAELGVINNTLKVKGSVLSSQKQVIAANTKRLMEVARRVAGQQAALANTFAEAKKRSIKI